MKQTIRTLVSKLVGELETVSGPAIERPLGREPEAFRIGGSFDYAALKLA